MTYHNANPKPGKKKKKKRGVSPAKLKKVYAEVMERDGYCCKNPYCENGYPLDWPHHIIFRSQMGKDVPENLILTCRYCHDRIHKLATLKVTGVFPELVWDEVE